MGPLEPRAPDPTPRALRLAMLLLVALASACGGEPFSLSTIPSLDGPLGDPLGDAGALVDAAPSRADTGRDGSPDAAADGARDAPPATDGGEPGADAIALDAPAEARDGSAVDGAADGNSPPPPSDGAVDAFHAAADAGPLCCNGAAAASCSATPWSCYPQDSQCSASGQFLPDGGFYQTATCTGAPSSCALGCSSGRSCLVPGTQAPGQMLPGTIGPCF
ncbi:MAG: hypothetical protein ACRDNM_00045 [Gaiellaceae bacterium]